MLSTLGVLPKRSMQKSTNTSGDSSGGLRIIGSDLFVAGWGWGVKAISLFKIGARRGLDVTAGTIAPILKRLIAVNTFVPPWGLRIIGSFFCLLLGWGGGGWGGGKGNQPFQNRRS